MTADVRTAHAPGLPRRARPSIGLRNAVSAELMRARRSAAARLVWLGLAVCLVQGVAWLGVSTGAANSWESLLAWQTLYGTGLVGAIAGLHAGLAAGRERAAREGGTWARPLPTSTALIAHLLVMSLQAAAFSAAVTLPLVLVGPLGGLSEPPWGRFAALWLVLTCGYLPPMVIGAAIARRAGIVPAVAVGIVWQVAGVLSAESALGAVLPWGWGVRALMPVIGIHANGTGLEEGSPVRDWAWPAPAFGCVALACALAVVLALAARVSPAAPARRGLLVRLTELAVPGRRHEGPASAHPQTQAPLPSAPMRVRLAALATPTGRSGAHPLRADLALLRRTAAWPLVGLTLAVLVLCAVIWGHDRVTGIIVWLVVPLGACILASIVHGASAPGWRVTALRRSAFAQARGLAVACLLMLTVIVGCGAALALLSRGDPAQTVRIGVLAWCVGAAALMVDLLLATRFGPAATYGTTLLVLVVSLVLGGTEIARTPAWAAGFFGWPFAADSAVRIGLVLVVCALVGAAAFVGWCAALRREAAVG